MCFSANVSFGASAVLTAIGIASIKKTKEPRQLFFAAIPLLFAAQQITEGFLWLTLRNHEYLYTQCVLTYIFIFFAQVLWPVWVPLSITLLDKKEARTTLQKTIIGIGVVVSAYLAFCLMTYSVEANINGMHIGYKQDYPQALKNYGALLYILAIIGPPFMSHIKKMWMLGVTVLLSYIISAIFYQHYVLSVWCFFASLISVSIYIIITKIPVLSATNPE